MPLMAFASSGRISARLFRTSSDCDLSSRFRMSAMPTYEEDDVVVTSRSSRSALSRAFTASSATPLRAIMRHSRLLRTSGANVPMTLAARSDSTRVRMSATVCGCSLPRYPRRVSALSSPTRSHTGSSRTGASAITSANCSSVMTPDNRFLTSVTVPPKPTPLEKVWANSSTSVSRSLMRTGRRSAAERVRSLSSSGSNFFSSLEDRSLPSASSSTATFSVPLSAPGDAAALARLGAVIAASLSGRPVAGARPDDLGQRDAEAGRGLIHHHHLAARDHATVDDHIDGLAHAAVERNDRAAPELDQAGDRHGGRAEHDLH